MRKIAIPKKVGAHKPTKIPNLSAWAFCSEPSPLLIFQIVIEPIMERRPNTKQIQDAIIIRRYITSCSFSKLFHPSPFLIRGCCLYGSVSWFSLSRFKLHRSSFRGQSCTAPWFLHGDGQIICALNTNRETVALPMRQTT